MPTLEADVGAPKAALIEASLQGDFTSEWRLDLGLRQAVSELLGGTARKAVVLITQGTVGTQSFSQYGLLESKQYLENNHIPLYCITLTPDRISEELEFLCRETGGDYFYLYEPAGIQPLVDDIFSYRSGTYYFTYNSTTYADFGRAFIPLEIEVFHFKRSGRDESGYFAPLQY
jgi:hypothetical protein